MAGSIVFSHIIPAILGFIGIIILISGIMDNDKQQTIIGVVLFIAAAIVPFLILSVML